MFISLVLCWLVMLERVVSNETVRAGTFHKVGRVNVLDGSVFTVVKIEGHPHEVLLPPSIWLGRTPGQICCLCVVIQADKITFHILIGVRGPQEGAGTG